MSASETVRRHRSTQSAKLRALLSDGEWHLNTELASTVTFRFGGTLHAIRCGTDGGEPRQIEKECLDRKRSLWRYRDAGPAEAPQLEESWQKRALRLERTCRELRQAVALLNLALEAQRKATLAALQSVPRQLALLAMSPRGQA